MDYSLKRLHLMNIVAAILSEITFDVLHDIISPNFVPNVFTVCYKYIYLPLSISRLFHY